ncbi:MAG TPA: serine/threonine-protein kinase [Kofleriaceae bacterium]|nr:serine/threonine-protein kinase [Kofleriaceae bacterium]
MTGIPFGKYQLVKRLARGGMAEVFLARQSGPEGFQRMVAVKRILPHLVDAQDFVRMFLDEARLAAQLSHPNIVHIYDFGKVDEHYFIAMEYVDGVHAGELIKRAESERIPDVLVARIGADACAGLHYAHELREAEGRALLHVVHRDVSPPNLIASYDGSVKLVDFGIAKAVSSIEHTRPGVVKGKFAYMSPEQTIGQKLDGRSDVFSLALVLWELLAGRVLVPRQDPVEGMRMIRDGRIPPIEGERPDIAPALAAALARALMTRRDDRCNALELGRALEEFIKGSTDGIGSTLELAEWVRDRFPRDGSGGDPSSPRDVPIGTRQATGATRTALPIADGSSVDVPVVAALPAVQARTGAHPVLEGRASTSELTSARMAALPPPVPAIRAHDAREWDGPPLAGRTGEIHRSSTMEAQLFDPEKDSVIVAPEWLVEEDGGPGLDTVAEPRGPDIAPADPSETAETNDFRLQRFDVDRVRRGAPDRAAAAAPTMNAWRPPSAHGGRRVGRIALIIAAGAALGVGSTLLWSRLGADDDDAGGDGAPGARPAPRAAAGGDGERESAGASAGGAAVAREGAGAEAADAVIEVVTAPSGADVALGDRAVLPTPARFDELAAGTYRLRVTMRGYQPVERQFEVAAGEHRTVDLDLVAVEQAAGGDRTHAPQPPASGTLKVRTRPSSEVYLGGRLLGHTPLVTELKPGRYTLSFKHQGRPAQRKTITVRGGDETRLDFALE